MKALSLWQPWATLFVMGLKLNETRSWKTAYRGPLLIHATLKFPREALDLAHSEFQKGLIPGPGVLPRGGLIGVVNIGDIQPVEVVASSLADNELRYGDYSAGRFAWMATDPHEIEFAPWKGSQGLFNVPDEIAAALLAAHQ